MTKARERVRPATRGGFTLIELLAVAAIVGILGCLLLPAVQAAREASRRLQCAHNLRQVGLALANYHEALGAWPMGYVAAPGGDAYRTSPGWGWATLILPQLEQGPVYAATNIDRPVEAAANLTARSAAIRVYACPSDTDSGLYTVWDADGWPIGVFHTNSYAACFGAGLDVGDFPDLGNGLFVRNRSIRAAEVLDGTSQTIAVGERGACLVKTPWAGTPNGGVSVIDDDGSRIAADYSSVGRGAELVIAHADTVGLNAPGTTPADFYSPHVGQANFLFADGSVRTLRATMDLPTYRAPCTRAGGEVVDPGSY